jgi:ATP-dependent 26S proteasome regulatory subunit
MGGSLRDANAILYSIRPSEQVNLQLALDHWVQADPGRSQLLGFASERFSRHRGLDDLLIQGAIPASVKREQVARSADVSLDCVTQGVYLLAYQDQPVVVLITTEELTHKQQKLEVTARGRHIAQAALNHLLDEARRRNIYKGKTVSLESEQEWRREVVIRFHELPRTSRESIVLPEKVLEVIERNVFGLLKHGEVLRRAGRGTRHGLLFHGPPGTGKTLVARYLAQACPKHTIILLTGRQLGLIRESCRLAKLLAPSMVILEDVDLVAGERTQNRSPTVLHELLDEMDGLGSQADAIFLLTTNRPDFLEPALAARPGRIDQAIEFPLPDRECRQRLFALYGKGLDLGEVSLDRWIDQTDGVSPAFIQELLRKAALMAAERGETSSPIKLRDDDVDQALKELVYFGGELTQRLLGYRPHRLGYRANRAE